MHITATYFYRPQKTNSQTVMVTDEVVSFVKNLRDSDLKRCNVIIDVINQEVLKCRSFMIDGEIVKNPEYHTLIEYFQRNHPTEVGTLLKAVENLTKVGEIN